MTKSKKKSEQTMPEAAAVEPVAEAVATTVIANPAGGKPQVMTLVGPAPLVMAEVCVHIRNGYIVDTDAPIRWFDVAGSISFSLKLGSPNQESEHAAKVSTADAVAQE